MARIDLHFPEPALFRTEIPVRIDDINFGGHLGHDSVLTLAHELRARFFSSAGYSELNIEGYGIIVADAAIVYRGEAFYGDILTAEVSAGDIAEKSFDLYYRFEKPERSPVAVAKTGIVIFDYSIRKAVPIPQGFLRLLKRN